MQELGSAVTMLQGPVYLCLCELELYEDDFWLDVIGGETESELVRIHTYRPGAHGREVDMDPHTVYIPACRPR